MNLACPHLLRETPGGYVLLGSRCRGCDEHYFPFQAGCTRCGGVDLEEVVLGDRGTLWTWTVQGFLPKTPYNSGETDATFRPYGVGYVEMPCGVKVESRLTENDPAKLRIGMPMRLVLEAYRTAEDGSKVHTFAFAPASEIGS